MKKTLFVLAACAAALASCQKSEIVSNASVDPVFTAGISQPTKTSVNAATGKVSWVLGDVITITDADSAAVKYEVSAIDNGIATLTKCEGEAGTLGSAPYKASYGQAPAAKQTYSAEAPALPMTAESQTTSLNFKTTCGLLKLTLTKAGQNIKSIKVGDYTLTCASPVDISAGADFYIALPEGEYTSFTFTNGIGAYYTKTMKSGNSLAIEANGIQPFTLSDALMEFKVAFNGWKNQTLKIKNTNFAFSPDRKTAYVLTYLDANVNRTLGAFDIATGACKWEFDTGYAVNNGSHFGVNPATGEILVPGDKKLLCLNADGTKKWEAALDGQTVGCGPAVSPDGDVIYVGTEAKDLCAFNASDGTKLGSVTGFSKVLAAIIVNGSELFVSLKGSKNCYFYDFSNPASPVQVGSTIALKANGTGIPSASVGPDKKTAYIPCSKYISCVDLETRTIVKEVTIGSDIVCGSVVTPSGDVAVVYKNDAGAMTLFSAGLAEKKWDFSPVAYNNNFNYNTAVTDENGDFYVVDGKGNAWFVKASDGKGTLLFNLPQTSGQTCTGMIGNVLFGAGNAAPAAVVGAVVPTSLNTALWAGHGGDPCCSNCIQWVYGK